MIINEHNRKWFYLIVVTLIWGGSFLLMKKALVGFTPMQVGALRLLLMSLLIVGIGFNSLKKIKRKHWKFIFISGVSGTLVPGFMLAFAVQGIDSSVVSVLTSMTPFLTLSLGVLFFSYKFKKLQLIGILIGLFSTAILILEGSDLNPNQNYWYCLFPILSSLGYALNANLIKKHLNDLPPLSIAAGGFLFLIIPSFLVLISTDFFTRVNFSSEPNYALIFILILSFSIGIGKILYNKLIQISTPLFSTSANYLVPMIAIFLGVVDGEKLSLVQLASGMTILLSIYIVNKPKKEKATKKGKKRKLIPAFSS